MKTRRLIVQIAVAVFFANPAISSANVYQEADARAVSSDFDGAYRLLKDSLLSKSFVNQSNALAIVRKHPAIIISGIRGAVRDVTQQSNCDSLSAGINEAKHLVVEYIGEISPRDREILAGEIDAIAKAMKANPPDSCKSKGDEINELSSAISSRATEEGRKAADDAEVMAKAKEAQLQRAGMDLETLQKRAKLIAQAEQSGRKATFNCKNATHCQKAFSVAQIFLSENADMKIQMANDTLIETYQPVKATSFYARLVKMPRAGTQSEIRLTLACRSDMDADSGINLCHSRRALVYEMFPIYMRQNVLD